MSSWHVWVDLIWYPSGRLMVSGLVGILMFLTRVPGSKKFPVVTASSIAWSIAMLICDVLNLLSARGDWGRGCSLMILLHAHVSCYIVLLLVTIVTALSYSACICNFWYGRRRIGGKHGIRFIYCCIFLFLPWPEHAFSFLSSSLLTMLMWIVLVPATPVSLSSILSASASTSDTSVHGILCLTDNVCKNPSFAKYCSILQGLVLCFHECSIVSMGLILVRISNVMFLWEWEMVPIMIYIVSTWVAVKEFCKDFDCVGEFAFLREGLLRLVPWYTPW